MGDYNESLYSGPGSSYGSVYGSRPGGHIPMSIHDAGGEISVFMGPVPSGLDGHTLVAISSNTVPPPNPEVASMHQILREQQVSSGAVFHLDATDQTPLIVKPGSVLYVATYSKQTKDGVDLGWGLCGMAWKVIPGNHGGVRASLESIPRGLMSPGHVYDEPEEGLQHAYVASMGRVLDTVVTDGELIIEDPMFIHPNMILPILRSWGMPPDEEALFSDEHLRHRLRSILASYRDLTMSKGTAIGLADYASTVSGIQAYVAGPVNKLLDRYDSIPDDPHRAPSLWDSSLSVQCDAPLWTSCPTTAYPDSAWLHSLWPTNRLALWYDTFQDVWGGEDVWEDSWSSLFVGANTAMRTPIEPPIHQDDHWWRHPVGMGIPNTWVHLMSGAAEYWFGSRQVGGKWIPDFMSPCKPDTTGYTLRYRVWSDAAGSSTPEIVFLDEHGNQLTATSVSSGLPHHANSWTDVSFETVAPHEARYVGFKISVHSASNKVVSLATISLTDHPPSSYLEPRSTAVLFDTGQALLDTTGSTMEDDKATMEDAVVTMESYGHTSVVESSLQLWERILINKLEPVLQTWAPVGVPIRILTSDSPEFSSLVKESHGYPVDSGLPTNP